MLHLLSPSRQSGNGLDFASSLLLESRIIRAGIPGARSALFLSSSMLKEPNSKLLVLFAGILVLLGWAYWSTLLEMIQRWNIDPQYTQGYVIPVLVFAVLWWRRKQFPGWAASNAGWGLGFVLIGVCLRMLATVFFLEPLDVFSLLPVLAGCLLCAGGWPLLKWACPGIVLLLFVIPMPYRIEVALTMPLRRIATQGSAFVLQVLGFPAIAEENIILVDDVLMGVVEACSGLGMLHTLFALTTCVAFFCERPWWEKGLIVCSALPITLVANVIRIASTGVLYEVWGSGPADVYYHSLAGWFMMPVALLLLWVEFKILDRLVEYVPERGPYFHDLPKPASDAVVPARVGS
jgi:exosortase